MTKRISLLFLVFLFCGFNSATPGETWSLTVSYKLTGKMGVGTALTTANGTAQLVDDGSGTFTGKGTLSVKEKVTAPGMTSSLSGSGAFVVQGKRQGTDLVFTFTGPSIPLKGTINAAGQSIPHEGSFEPSACTAGDATIERKEGAMAAHKTLGAGGGSDLKAVSLFTLAGGQNVVQKPKAPDPKQASDDDVWTLELEATQDYTVNAAGNIKGSGHDTLTGKLEFVLPEDDGPVDGEGTLTYKAKFKWTSPMPTHSDTSCKGVLVLEGKVENDTLTFIPRAKLTSVDVKQGGSLPFQGSSSFGGGQEFFNATETVSVPVENNAETVLDYTDSRHGMNMTAKHVWRLRGKKIEKWRITIDDYRINYLLNEGSGEGNKRCGIKVHARRIIEVELENDTFRSGQDKSSFVSLKGYSHPPWAYTCKAGVTTIIGTGSDIDAERFDQVRWTERFNPPKTEGDAELKKEWEKIKKHKTPYIYSETFAAGGTKAGKQLSLALPAKSGYTIAIYAKLNVEAVKKHGYTISKSKRIEWMGIEEGVLDSKFTVTLVDGWTHEDAPPSALDRTTLKVEKKK